MDYTNTERKGFEMINPIYQTIEMKSLNPLSRVEIILVNEKLKQSVTILGEEYTEAILKKLGLKYVITKTPNGFVADITYDDNIYEHYKNMRDFEEHLIKEEQENKTEQEIANDMKEWQMNAPHEYVGNIYGYPKCCIDAYTERMRTGIYPEELADPEQIPEELYCISHKPCSLKCKASLELGRKYMNILREIDPEALKALITFNKTGSLTI